MHGRNAGATRATRPGPVTIEPDAWCEWCGEALPEKEERHPRMRFCGRACQQAARVDDLKQARLALRPERACGHCGTVFRAKGPAHRFCSDSCGQRAKYRRRTERSEDAGAACVQCGVAVPLGFRYCSATCRALYLRTRGAAARQAWRAENASPATR
jgi:predicted nucleic acid-binding Zn ribbon protein